MIAQILRWPSRAVIALLISAIWIYQVTLSRLLSAFGPVCRFEPTCSRYMVEALKKYGLVRGLLKGMGRVARCHPWNPGGIDPP